MANTLMRLSPYGYPSYTFSRLPSTTVGSYVNANGVLTQVTSATTPRIEYVDLDGDGVVDTPGFLLEETFTNLVSSDDVSTWTDVATAAVTSSVYDPANGTGAYTITGDGGSTLEGRYHAPASFTGNTAKTVTFVVKEATMPASGNQRLSLYDQTAAADRLVLDITAWTSGEPSVTASTGTLLGQRYIGSGFWAIYGRSTSVTAANTHRVYVYSNVSASAGAITVYRVNVYDDQYSPAGSIVDASEILPQDTFYVSFPHAPQAMTAYVKFIELGTVTGGYQILWIGGTDLSVPYFSIGSDSTKYYGRHGNGVSTLSSSLSAAPEMGDVVELRVVLAADGSVQAHQSINGAAETSATATAALPFASAWAGSRLYINSTPLGSEGRAIFLDVKIVSGSQSLAAMRSIEPFLSLNGVEVGIADGRKERVEIGDSGRMFDGTFRRTIRNRVNTWRCETAPISDPAEYAALVEQLESTTQPYQAIGKLVEGVDGVYPLVQTRITGERFVISNNRSLPVVEFDMEESS